MVLNAFLNSKTSCSLSTQLLEVEDRDGEENEASIVQGEMVRDLLHHLDPPRSVGLDGIHPRGLREFMKGLIEPFSITYQQSWLLGEVPGDGRSPNVTDTHLPEGPEGGSGSYGLSVWAL